MLSHVAAGVVYCSISFVQAPTLEDGASSEQPPSGVSASFWWADYDLDGLADAFVVGSEGAARLLRSSGDGSFADVTRLSGLDGLDAASFAAWHDYDRDGAPDVFVGTQSGPGHLLRNAGDGTFQDVTQFVGLNHSGRHLAAQWFDYDLDGLIDFSVRTDAGEHLYHAISNGHFELIDLGEASPPRLIELSTESSEIKVDLATPVVADKDSDRIASRRPAPSTQRGGTGALDTPTRMSSAPTLPPPGSYLISACPPKVADTSGGCLSANSVATLGMLYPLSINLNVSGAGNVGIGTTTPAAKLDVVGAAHVSGTLTLDPSGDQALNVNTGSIYKGGALFLHTRGGANNTALGRYALANVTSGQRNFAGGGLALRFNTIGANNTASGIKALYSNTTGNANTANGFEALHYNTGGSGHTATGYRALFSTDGATRNTANGRQALYFTTGGSQNTAIGDQALFHNTTGDNNCATGLEALYYNTTGTHNTAAGYGTLFFNTTGSWNSAIGTFALRHNTSGNTNIALGYKAGYSLTSGSYNIAIGNNGVAGDASTIRLGSGQTRSFIAGIRGVTTVNANAVAVLIDSAGQLGTVSSSRRFKKDIVDMGDATEKLLELRPVRFRYKQEQTMPDGSEVPMEYGLIAEEVAEVFPDLVVYGDDGKPFTVKYHILASMLLNEVKQEKAEHARELEELRGELSAQSEAHASEQAAQARVNANQQVELTRLRGLEARLAAVEARTSATSGPPVVIAGGR